jgi:hypothetical protein
MPRGPGSAAAAGKKASTLREQAAMARKRKGMTPEQRTAAAAVKYSFWRTGAPTSGLGAQGTYKRSEAASKTIEASPHSAAVAKARAEVQAKIEQFKAKRETPTLQLGQHEGKLKVKEYGTWGEYKGTKTITPHTPVNPWERQKTDMPTMPKPSPLEQREYKNIAARSSLQPTASDIARQRKLQGITGRIPKVIIVRGKQIKIG